MQVYLDHGDREGNVAFYMDCKHFQGFPPLDQCREGALRMQLPVYAIHPVPPTLTAISVLNLLSLRLGIWESP